MIAALAADKVSDGPRLASADRTSLGTVAFFALWVVALKPSSSTGQRVRPRRLPARRSKAAQAPWRRPTRASAAHGGTVPQTASAAAHLGLRGPRRLHGTGERGRHDEHDRAGERAAATTPGRHDRAGPPPGDGARPQRTPAPHTCTSPSSKRAAQRYAVVAARSASHKVLALLFYNPAAADDRAVKAELKAVPTHQARW